MKALRNIQTVIGFGLMVLAFAVASTNGVSTSPEPAKVAVETTSGFALGTAIARLGNDGSKQARLHIQNSDDPRSVAMASIARSLSGRR